ncbi:MAG: carbon monoxide dehydrogenase subunit G [Burkholderiales bacterium]|nr:MAG: carbon monoxide dehydrogenase subunit G [Burkholderiales bacterium]
MELRGERLLAADRATAWAALNDTEMLRLCVPGCESIIATGENQFEIVMTAAVGPVKARFKGKMALADIDAPNAYTMKFDASGGQTGFARGEARVTLTEQSSRQTKLTYVANAHIGGKLAQVGSRLIDAAAGATADKFFEAFGAQLAARAAPAAEAGAPAQPVAPARIGFFSLLLAFLKRLFGRA